MATIQTALQLYDGMSRPLESISNVINTVINTFEELKITSADSIDSAALQTAGLKLESVSASVAEMEMNLKRAALRQEEFNSKIREGKSGADGLGGKVKQYIEPYLGIKGIQMGIQFVADAISLQNVQDDAEAKLGAVMQQHMGASPAEIQSIKTLTKAQQGSGVVGDAVQLAGAQQLAAFLETSDALSTLVPAMNNLAVQQKGVNVGAQDAVAIGNALGKAMQGQVGALTSVGITFTEAQEQVLKYGDEQERAAALAQVITDRFGNINEVMSNTPQGQIQQMANNWQDMKETVGAKLYPAVILFFKVLNTCMPQAEGIVMGLTNSFNAVITVLSWLANGVGAVVSFFQDYWPIIEPLIWGVATAMGMYLLMTKGVGAAQTAGRAITTAYQAAQTFLSIGFGVLTGNTAAASAAVMTYNSALMASPITWIIICIIALVAIVYAAVGAFNKFTGASVSAAGVIAGAFAVLGAFLINTFIIPVWNMTAALVNFFYNVWNDPVAAVKILFLNMANSVVGYMVQMAHAIETIINRIPGVHVDITSGLDSLKSRIEDTAAKVKSESEWKEIVSAKDYIDYGDAAGAGYHFGQKFDTKVKGLFSGDGINLNDYSGIGSGVQETWDNIGGNTGNTADNTAAMANSMDMAEEDLQSMRDMAEQEAINRFTTADLTVNMGGITNQVNSSMDLDGIGNYLESTIFEVLETAAEGVY